MLNKNILIGLTLFVLVSCSPSFWGNSNRNSASNSISDGASLIFDASTLTGASSPGGTCSFSSWKDSSGSGNNGTIYCAGGGGFSGSGIPADPYKIVFSGSTSVTTLLDAQSNRLSSSTWIAWIKPTFSSFQQILSIDDHIGNFNRSLLIDGSSGDFGVYNPFNSIWTTRPVDVGVWQFVAVTFTPTDIVFTKNGTFINLGVPPNYPSSAQKFTIGRSAAGLFDFFTGGIAWIAVYPRALTPLEINNTCKALLPMFSGASCN